MRTCPRCGDFYADASSAFCLRDGTPLVEVSPTSETWGEAVRVVEEKGNVLRKLERRQRWRRILMTATTMLVVVMVVCVVVVHSIIYFNPRPEPDVSAATSGPDDPPSTPTPTPTPVCSDAGEASEREAIIEKFGGKWERDADAERAKIIAAHTPRARADVHGNMNVNVNSRAGGVTVEAKRSAIRYESTFPRPCAASMTARYEWRVRIIRQTPAGQRVEEPSVENKKRFDCRKKGTAWSCR